YLQPVQDVRVGGRAATSQYQYTLQSENLEALVEWTPKVYQRLKTIPGLVDVNSDQQNAALEASVRVDRATAARLGITAEDIDAILYDAFGQRPVSTIYTPLNQYRVIMEVDPRFSQDPGGLKLIYLTSRSGQPTPLSTFAEYARDTAPLSINHQ